MGPALVPGADHALLPSPDLPVIVKLVSGSRKEIGMAKAASAIRFRVG
jgi:hypothetical protein